MAAPKRKTPARAATRLAREIARVPLPGGVVVPITVEPLTPAQIDMIVTAARPSYLRGELVNYRRDLMRDGQADAARKLTRLLADFDFISRGLVKPARKERGEASLAS
ncbi:hypothetical protein [Methylocystis parvus]|uniref:hypothetical protein n=1 Tax=Methylocystis parvus TaxID=134 RepID=UPI003C72D01E